MNTIDWNKKLREEEYPWMNDGQFAAYEMLVDLCRGAHHIGGIVKPCGPKGIEVNIRFGFHAATFDYNDLTRAVVFAHDRCIRFEIEPSGPGMLKLCLHKRSGRDGTMSERHPTLEDAIKVVRGAV